MAIKLLASSEEDGPLMLLEYRLTASLTCLHMPVCIARYTCREHGRALCVILDVGQGRLLKNKAWMYTASSTGKMQGFLRSGPLLHPGSRRGCQSCYCNPRPPIRPR